MNILNRNVAYIVLGLIIIAGLALRLYKLDTIPYGALVDEAHFGYIAHSLLETGKDEHGTTWPLIFQGFGDQKLPAYAYSLIPFVWLFDLSVFTIRFPSALAGTGLIIAIYWLSRNIGLSRV